MIVKLLTMKKKLYCVIKQSRIISHLFTFEYSRILHVFTYSDRLVLTKSGALFLILIIICFLTYIKKISNLCYEKLGFKN